MTMRRGITIVELLVVIGVIALLLALTLPALTSAREAARRAQCGNNLKQLGLAIHNYLDQFGMFPPGNLRKRSLHVAILPQIERFDLYWRFPADSAERDLVSMAAISVPLFICPSDPASEWIGGGDPVHCTNYAGNFGSGVQTYGYNGMFQPIEMVGAVRPRDVTDGLSATAAIAEILVRDGTDFPLRVIWMTPFLQNQPSQLDEFAALCRDTGRSAAGPHIDDKGSPWTFGDPGATLYNHVLFPNDVSCTNEALAQLGAHSAGSMHPGGVHVLFADGHVQFVATHIDLAVWRATGSRNGGEAETIANQ